MDSVKDIINKLKGLTGDARLGMLDALQDILDSRKLPSEGKEGYPPTIQPKGKGGGGGEDDPRKTKPVSKHGGDGGGNSAQSGSAVLDKVHGRRDYAKRTIQAVKEAKADVKKNTNDKETLDKLDSAIKTVQALVDMSDTELAALTDKQFNDIVNDALDMADSILNINFESEDEDEGRIKKIAQDAADVKLNRDITKADEEHAAEEHGAIQAREKAASSLPGSGAELRSMDQFADDLYFTVSSLVTMAEKEEDSWSALDRRHEGEPILRPGIKIDDIASGTIPVIDVYFDNSGSWSKSDHDQGIKAIKAISKFEDMGKIKINLYYFGDYIRTTTFGTGGGTSAWYKILANIQANKAENVILMTDTDMENQAYNDRILTIPGVVWFIWKSKEEIGTQVTKHLQGKTGTFHYVLK